MTTRIATREETPEQVLARLERYAASVGVKAPPAAPLPYVAPPVVRAPAAEPAPPVSAAPATPTRPAPGPIATRREVLRITLEAMGYAVGLVCCVVAIFLFQEFDRAVASTVIAILVLGGAIATARRYPLALWWTLGFVIGGVIARLS